MGGFEVFALVLTVMWGNVSPSSAMEFGPDNDAFPGMTLVECNDAAEALYDNMAIIAEEYTQKHDDADYWNFEIYCQKIGQATLEGNYLKFTYDEGHGLPEKLTIDIYGGADQ